MNTKQALEQQMKEERSAVLVVNTHSRQGQQLFFKAVDFLEQRGIHVTASYPVRHPDRLPEVIQEAIARGNKLIVVGGGDGTLSAIVDYLAYQNVVLGLLPLGTGNSFARSLGIPLSLEGAIEVITNGKVADIDLGKVDDDYFANVASIGFSAEVARKTSRRLKRFFGVVAYGWVGITNLFARKSFVCKFTYGGDIHTIKTHQVVIANGSFFGINKIAPDAHIDNRQLVVFTMDDLNRWEMVGVWLGFFLGIRRAYSQTHYFTIQKMLIEIDPVQYVAIDGEGTTQTPVTVSLAPEALKVMVPQTFEDRD